jgi:hypothetical protein
VIGCYYIIESKINIKLLPKYIVIITLPHFIGAGFS